MEIFARALQWRSIVVNPTIGDDNQLFVKSKEKEKKRLENLATIFALPSKHTKAPITCCDRFGLQRLVEYPTITTEKNIGQDMGTA